MLDDLISKASKIAKPKYIRDYNNFNPKTDTVLYSGPYWDHRELEFGLKAFLNGNWVSTGENTQNFQNNFSKRFNVKYSLMVNSGSSANLVMITALKHYLNWKDNTEIIVSPVGFPTTIACIIQNNMKPRFIDIEFKTLNFDVELIEDAINNKTKAIFVSPVLGNPPDMDKISALCSKHNLILIGDNCDSLGTKWNNKLITDLYYSWSTSFYPAHHISTGEGGMISSNDKALMDIARSIAWWGRGCFCVGVNNLLPEGSCGRRFDHWLENYDGLVDHKYIFSNIGYNLKPLDLQGAIGLAQLEKFDEIDKKRRQHKNRLKKLLINYLDVRIAETLELSDPSWFGVPIICESQKQKESLVEYLETNRIQTRNYFGGNILYHPGFQHLDNYENFPNSNRALSHVFFLGCPPSWNDKVFEYIEDVVKKC